MNNSGFGIYLLLSFLVGSLWITFTTVIVDRSGSRIGGFLGGLPSTTAVFPLIYGFTGLFLVVFAIIGARGFGRGLAVALGVWFSLCTLVVVTGFRAACPRA